MDENCRGNYAIEEQFYQYKNPMIDKLEHFSPMCDGHLGHSTVEKHRIDLKGPDARPMFSKTYRAGPAAQAIRKEKLEKLEKLGVVEPAITETTARIVF